MQNENDLENPYKVVISIVILSILALSLVISIINYLYGGDSIFHFY